MATIPVPGSELRHVRKTITFTGGAGAGAIGTVTVFALTGRVLIQTISGFVTSSLVSAGGGSISWGTANGASLKGASLYSDLITDRWITGDGHIAGLYADWYSTNYGSGAKATTSETIIGTVTVADITGGVIVFDVWYTPITDNGALAGDDIDEPARDHFWAKALSDLAAVPAATASVLAAINWLFMLGRNKRTQTATTETVYKDDGSTAAATSTKSDDGTTFTRGEMG